MKKKFGKTAKVHWEGTKCIWGMPISFTHYYIVEQPGKWIKLFFEKGFLHTEIEEVQLYRIDDFSIFESIINKAFGVGNIQVYFSDASHNSLIIKRIKNVYEVYNLLTALIEKDRERRKISHAEFQK